MVTKRSPDQGASGTSFGRKSWKKKSPEQVVFAQEEKLRQEIDHDKALLRKKREQLAKFEQARKIFESP